MVKDHKRINEELLLEKQMTQLHSEERRAQDRLQKAKAMAQLDRKRRLRDGGREGEQVVRAKMLLRRANSEAAKATSALANAHKLRMSSESEVCGLQKMLSCPVDAFTLTLNFALLRHAQKSHDYVPNFRTSGRNDEISSIHCRRKTPSRKHTYKHETQTIIFTLFRTVG